MVVIEFSVLFQLVVDILLRDVIIFVGMMMVVVLLICLLEEELYFIGGLVEVEFDFIVEQVVASFLVLHSFEEVFF